MIDAGVVFDKLNNFDTADELADYFQAEGIQALPGEPEQCAIAQFVANQTGRYVYVDGASIAVYHENMRYIVDREFACNAQMRDFITRFDAFEYRDIVHPNVLSRDCGCVLYNYCEDCS